MTNTNRRAFFKSSLAIAVSGSLLATGNAAFAAQGTGGELRSLLQQQDNFVAGIPLRHKDQLVAVYTERDFAPLWSMNGQYTDTCRAIVNRLSDSSLSGLHPARYYTRILNSWLQLQEPRTIMNLELILTDALFEYFDNLANGQTGKRPGDSASWFAKQDNTKVDSDTSEFLQTSTSFQEVTDRVQPSSPQYHRLLKALADQHAILAEGGYVNIADGSTLKPGMRHARITQLRQRLSQSGDYLVYSSSNYDYFDSTVEQSLKTFQRRHGLEADGLLGKRTLKELNITIEERIAQIEINLDRWRWLPQDLGENYIIVNSPGFQMDVFQHGQHTLNMDVVVGKAKHATPVFSKKMKHLVFNPSWNVPKSIASKELLPKEIANPGYLKSRHFVAVSHTDKGTRALDSFAQHELEPSSFTRKYRLRQLPGSHNALGKVKFMLPNKHAIYLHDTTAQSLFKKTVRTYSHGCVRVEDPVKLAKILLINENHSERRVEKLFTSSRSQTVVLKEHLPVHMTYQTAWVDQIGTLNFRPDIYGHDSHALRNYQYQRPTLLQAEQQLLTQLDGFVVNDIL